MVLVGLAKFRGTDWYAWQRTRPPSRLDPAIGGLVAIGILVGGLGGMAAPFDDGAEVRITVAGR